jgi:hypothetical protein
MGIYADRAVWIRRICHARSGRPYSASLPNQGLAFDDALARAGKLSVITSTSLQGNHIDVVFQSCLGQIDDVAVMGEENHL